MLLWTPAQSHSGCTSTKERILRMGFCTHNEMRLTTISDAFKRWGKKISHTCGCFALHICRAIPRTLAIGTILVGVSTAQTTQLNPNPWSRDGVMVGRWLSGSVHLEDSTRGANNG